MQIDLYNSALFFIPQWVKDYTVQVPTAYYSTLDQLQGGCVHNAEDDDHVF